MLDPMLNIGNDPLPPTLNIDRHYKSGDKPLQRYVKFGWPGFEPQIPLTRGADNLIVYGIQP